MPPPDFIFYTETLPEDNNGKPSFVVVSFEGTEEISRLFEFNIEVKVYNDVLNQLADKETYFDTDIVEEQSTFIMQVDGHSKTFRGVVSSIASGVVGNDHEIFHLTLRPELWKETLTRTSQGYSSHDNSTPYTVKDILDEEIDEIEHELPGLIENRLTLSDYPSRPFTCQYDESNFDFMSRLMEKYGIYYYLDQGEDKILIADDSLYPKLSDVYRGFTSNDEIRVFKSRPGAESYFSSVYSISRQVERVPRCVTVTQFSPAQPSNPISECYPPDFNAGYRYGVHLTEYVFSAEEAAFLAQVRYEELISKSRRTIGESGICLLTPGYEVTLSGWRHDMLITKVRHEGNNLDDSSISNATQQYRNQFSLIESSKQFRPERRTPVPNVSNTETGRIFAETVGSEFAEIDEFGRYRVGMNFVPEVGTGSDMRKVSHWVRMAQPAAGAEDSFFIPLKADVEVILSFIGGNPDHPVITGALPNAMFPSFVNTENANEALIGTEGLLAFKSLGGHYKNVKVKDSAPDWTQLNFIQSDLEADAADDIRELVIDSSNSITHSTVIGDAAEIGGDYIINRRYGQRYNMTIGDTINEHKGNIFDFGGYWVYNLGNCYVENHMDQEAILNSSADFDILDAGGPNWTGWRTVTGATPGLNLDRHSAISSYDNSYDWTNGHVWVTKTFGDSYDYRKGGSVTINDYSDGGGTQTVTIGGTHVEEVFRGNGKKKSETILNDSSQVTPFHPTGGGVVEKKWTSSGIRTLYRHSKSGKVWEEKYDRHTGNRNSLKITDDSIQGLHYSSLDATPTKTSINLYRKHSDWFSINVGAEGYGQLNVYAKGGVTFNFFTNTGLNLGITNNNAFAYKAEYNLAGKVEADFSASAFIKMSMGVGIGMNVELKPTTFKVNVASKKAEFEGLGAKALNKPDIDAEIQKMFMKDIKMELKKKTLGVMQKDLSVEDIKGLHIKTGFEICGL